MFGIVRVDAYNEVQSRIFWINLFEIFFIFVESCKKFDEVTEILAVPRKITKSKRLITCVIVSIVF